MVTCSNLPDYTAPERNLVDASIEYATNFLSYKDEKRILLGWTNETVFQVSIDEDGTKLSVNNLDLAIGGGVALDMGEPDQKANKVAISTEYKEFFFSTIKSPSNMRLASAMIFDNQKLNDEHEPDGHRRKYLDKQTPGENFKINYSRWAELLPEGIIREHWWRSVRQLLTSEAILVRKPVVSGGYPFKNMLKSSNKRSNSRKKSRNKRSNFRKKISNRNRRTMGRIRNNSNRSRSKSYNKNRNKVRK